MMLFQRFIVSSPHTVTGASVAGQRDVRNDKGRQDVLVAVGMMKIKEDMMRSGVFCMCACVDMARVS